MIDNTLNLIEDFKANDLLFGLEKEARALYRTALESKLKLITTRQETYLTVDDINKKLSPYLIFARHYRESPFKAMESPVRTHAANWLKNTTLHPSMADLLEDSPARENLKFLQSCKVALAAYPGKIRFCLDGLMMDSVRNPTHQAYNSYTSEELRYVAINWEQLANKVVFYMHGQRVDAPWGQQQPTTWLRDYQLDDENRDINIAASFKTPTKPYSENISRLHNLKKKRRIIKIHDFNDENLLPPQSPRSPF